MLSHEKNAKAFAPHNLKVGKKSGKEKNIQVFFLVCCWLKKKTNLTN
jgi:hypothetical protein